MLVSYYMVPLTNTFTKFSPVVKTRKLMLANSTKSNLYNYSKIISLDKSPSVNFYGRVINFKAPRQTRGSDWMMTLVVIDDSFEGRADLSTQNPAGLSINIFKKNPNEFPAVKQVGDIVQFRHFKIQYYESYIQALSTNWSAYTVFHRENENGPWIVSPAREIYPEEIEVVEKLSKMKIGFGAIPSENDETTPETSTIRTSISRPTLSVGEVRHGIYFNGTFKIVKISEPIEAQGDSNQFSLLICDYTENPFLTSDPEVLGLPKHLSGCLLPVTLWDNFAEEAKRLKLKAGDYVYFDNLLGRQVIHANGIVNVVAVMHGDPKAKLLDNFIKVQRECKKIESQATRLAQLKQTVIESEDQIIEAAKPNIKEVPMVQTVQKQQQQVKSRKQQTKRTFAIKSEPEVIVNSESKAQSPSFTTTSVGSDSYAITTILSVRSFPADHAKFCVKARIVSIGLNSLYEMVRYHCNLCDCTTNLTTFMETYKCSNCQVRCSTSEPKFLWLFTILIEDATGDLVLIAADEDAVEFLKCPAFNLCDPNESDKLKQVTSIVEQLLTVDQSEHLLCIKSYRIEDDDGISHMRYRLFNTKLI